MLSGLFPAIALILARPFLPESPIWQEKKSKGTLKRPSFVELFRPTLRRTMLVTTLHNTIGGVQLCFGFRGHPTDASHGAGTCGVARRCAPRRGANGEPGANVSRARHHCRTLAVCLSGSPNCEPTSSATCLSRSGPDCLFLALLRHEIEELLTQRIMAIACGYEDANDAARLACDPVHKLLVGRDPVEGEDLASQSTPSRFENSVDRKALFRMAEALADTVIARHRKRLRGRAGLITLDLDPTDDPTHGAQQLTFFNWHYDTYCYLPMVGFLTFNHEVEQYLVTAVLRPGNAPGSAGAVGLLRRLIERPTEAFPKAKVRVMSYLYVKWNISLAAVYSTPGTKACDDVGAALRG
jgi:hypothetical protein